MKMIKAFETLLRFIMILIFLFIPLLFLFFDNQHFYLLYFSIIIIIIHEYISFKRKSEGNEITRTLILGLFFPLYVIGFISVSGMIPAIAFGFLVIKDRANPKKWLNDLLLGAAMIIVFLILFKIRNYNYYKPFFTISNQEKIFIFSKLFTGLFCFLCILLLRLFVKDRIEENESSVLKKKHDENNDTSIVKNIFKNKQDESEKIITDIKTDNYISGQILKKDNIGINEEIKTKEEKITAKEIYKKKVRNYINKNKKSEFHRIINFNNNDLFEIIIQKKIVFITIKYNFYKLNSYQFEARLKEIIIPPLKEVREIYWDFSNLKFKTWDKGGEIGIGSMLNLLKDIKNKIEKSNEKKPKITKNILIKPAGDQEWQRLEILGFHHIFGSDEII
jgi:hypothetical protein